MFDIVNNMTVVFVTHDISEAVLLSDEVWMMRSAPGKIIDRIKINLPYHRTMDIQRDPAFSKIVFEIEDRMKSIQSIVDKDKAEAAAALQEPVKI